ncbi:unnamed protein product [Fusarium graminearum]|uniref:Uncharacterized protein n=1 Tax=Gibberella zeae TaxID=5518 RepID=A0A4E9EAC0_GIBZA|nr:unnamed protein product [Fusarium graminearum]CAF3553238.1 unnamed protein product [Fusarium graminearum]CAF3567389.1 unnamed protein product [Fusarium graminearum]CAG1971472.1 unnamed protein product [Fusarium graminearum]CAG2007967.1 unnamed protein product [Fusarium graminearum]
MAARYTSSRLAKCDIWFDYKLTQAIRPFDAHIRGKLKFQGRGRDKLQWKPSGPLLSKPIHAAMPTGLCPFLTLALNIFSGSLVS